MHRIRSFHTALMAAAILASPLSSPLVAQAGEREHFDILFRGGRVLDGSGNPWIRADVGIRGDRVAAVGDLARATADTLLDIAGLYLAPGFIDTHSHAGAALETERLSGAYPLLAQGITTVFVNPDGGGRVDLAAQRQALVAHGLGLNVGLMVPHGSVRQAVLGMQDRPPSPEELRRMEAMVEQGMAEGAFALSSGPFYAPGSFAVTDELIALARVAARQGGAYQSHVRDEGNYGIGVLAAIDEVITVAREAQTRGVVTHIKALGPPVWGASSQIVERIERARAEGVELFADQYPYDASSTSLQAALLPRWAERGGRDSLQARLADPAERGRLVAAMEENLARRGGADRIRISHHVPDSSVQGATLAAIAARRGTPPVEAALAMIQAGGAGIVSFNMHPDDVARLMVQPWTMTASDGGLLAPGAGVPHPRNMGAFARKLRAYVLDQQLLDLSAAIRSMTSLPAAVYRVPDRGWIRAGAVADLVVFDLTTIRDLATYDEPHHPAEGMVHVLVNGRFAIRAGAATGTLAGQVLRRP